MKHLTPTQRGALAEAGVAAAAIELGFNVLRPLCEGGRYDLAIDIEPTLLRVQCKLARRLGEVLLVNVRTNRYTPGGYVSTHYTPAEIDAVATYTPDLRQCHLVPVRELGDRSLIHLRLAPTKNNQSDGITWARDYELGVTLEKLRLEQARPCGDITQRWSDERGLSTMVLDR